MKANKLKFYFFENDSFIVENFKYFVCKNKSDGSFTSFSLTLDMNSAK